MVFEGTMPGFSLFLSIKRTPYEALHDVVTPKS